MATRPDPFTHRHLVGDIIYADNGSQCTVCGRKWYTWTTPEGQKLMLTEPRYPKGTRYTPEP